MAEVKEEKERAIYKSTLEEIVSRINENLKSKHIPNEIVVKEGRSIGILTFNKNQEAKSKKLYAITMVIDGKQFDYIYDETGDNIARVVANKDVFTDDDIQFDREKLLRNMELSQDIQNDNQGRHIADKQEKVISAEEKQHKKNDIENNKTLNNLMDMDISVDSSAAIIDLYRTIYNGRRLRDLLGIDEKLIDRMPQGANIEHMNYLGVVNSANLTAKDGKSRNSTVTCVIMDDPRNPKHMVELDESILKPREDLSRQENITADKSSERLGDGGRRTGTTTTANTKQISTFEIPGGGASVGQPDDLLTLEIRQNPKYIDESTSQRNDAHNIEMSLGVQNISKTENELQHGLNTQSIKLEAYDEVKRIEEIEQQRDFANHYGGVDDEYEYKNNYDSDIDIAFKTIGEEKYHVRDAQELNKYLKEDLNKHIEEMKKQGKNGELVTAEIATVVENRSRYWEVAHDIANSSDVFGYIDVYYQICKIERDFKKENRELSDLTNNQIKELVQERLESERVLGESINPRKMY